MWVATSLLRYKGRVYRKGASVPAGDDRAHRSLTRMGRLRWVDDPVQGMVAEPEEASPTPTDHEPPTGETGDDVPSLDWTRAALDAYADTLGLDVAGYPNKASVLDAIEEALTAPGDGGDT